MRILKASTSLLCSDGVAFEITLAGCKGHCKGCHSKDTWNFEQGEYLDIHKRIDIITNILERPYDNIVIMGGEPLDNDIMSLYKFLNYLKQVTKLPIWLFTHYEYKEVPEEIKEVCDYIKTGKYDENKLTEYNVQYGVKLASSNQWIYKVEDDGQIKI